MAQLQAGMSTDPIRSKWQGVARLSDALFGSLALQRAPDQAGRRSGSSAISILMIRSSRPLVLSLASATFFLSAAKFAR
jgi:hypothetical protein